MLTILFNQWYSPSAMVNDGGVGAAVDTARSSLPPYLRDERDILDFILIAADIL